MRFIDWILVAVTGLWAAEGCFGAELKGRITDLSGAALAGSTVVARSASGLAARQVTDELGGYRFADLEPGVYSLRITKAGFSTSPAYEVAVQGSETLDCQLGAPSVVRSVGLSDGPVVAPASILRDAAEKRKWTHVKLLPEWSYTDPAGQQSAASASARGLKRYTLGADLAMAAYRQSTQLAPLYNHGGSVDLGAASIRVRFTF